MEAGGSVKEIFVEPWGPRSESGEKWSNFGIYFEDRVDQIC